MGLSSCLKIIVMCFTCCFIIRIRTITWQRVLQQPRRGEQFVLCDYKYIVVCAVTVLSQLEFSSSRTSGSNVFSLRSRRLVPCVFRFNHQNTVQLVSDPTPFVLAAGSMCHRSGRTFPRARTFSFIKVRHNLTCIFVFML